MKKRHIVLTLAVVLGSAWLGGSWYSGKLLAEQYPQFVERANNELAQVSLTSPYKLEYKTMQYSKHLFTTTIEDQLVVTNTKSNKSYTLPFKILVEHGPLPLSHLLTLRWLPVMASGNIELLNDPSISSIFEATDNKTPFNGDFSVGYDQTVAQIYNFAAINYHSEDGKTILATTPFKLISNTDLHGMGKIETHINNLSLTSFAREQDEDELLPFKVILNDLTIKSDYSPTAYKNIGVGTQNIELGSLHIFDNLQADAKAYFSIKNVQVNGDMALDKDSVNIHSKLQANSLNISEQNLGNVFYDIAINHLDAKTLNELTELIRKANNVDELEQKLQHASRALFQHQPALKIQPFSLTNSVGENKITADIAFAQTNWQKALIQDKVFSLFDRFSVNIEVNKPALTETVKSLALIDNSTDTQVAQREAQADINEMLQSAVEENIFHQQNDNDYTFDLKLDNGELKLNGQALSEKDIANMLLMGFLSVRFY